MFFVLNRIPNMPYMMSKYIFLQIIERRTIETNIINMDME